MNELINKPKEESRIISLQKNKPIIPIGESISRICSSFYFINKDCLIEDLASDLEKLNDVYALGVVDNNEEVLGIIIRKELFDKLGKNFGRDVYKRKTVQSVIKTTRIFNAEKNIFSVAEELKNELYESKINYYLLTDSYNKFYGIFSTKDLLIYLSLITQNDINLAKNLQMNIVKDENYIETDNFSIIGSSRMAKGVGGDFYTIKKISENKWLFAICDVCGKGISASLISAIIGGMINIYDFQEKGVKNFILSLNSYIFNTFQLEKYLTALFVEFDESNSEMRIFDMGHSLGESNIYLFRDNKFRLLETKNYNLAIGISLDMTANSDSFLVNPNDLIIMITDGVTDQRNPKDESYGIENFLKIIKKNISSNLKTIKNEFYEDINNFKSTSNQHDDITLILFRKK